MDESVHLNLLCDTATSRSKFISSLHAEFIINEPPASPKAVLQLKLDMLEKNWAEIENKHEEIIKLIAQSVDFFHYYFNTNVFDTAFEQYNAIKIKLVELIHSTPAQFPERFSSQSTSCPKPNHYTANENKEDLRKVLSRSRSGSRRSKSPFRNRRSDSPPKRSHSRSPSRLRYSRSRSRSPLSRSRSRSHSKQPSPGPVSSNPNRPCPMCASAAHSLWRCEQFLDLNLPERKQFLRERFLCYNCMGPHSQSECLSRCNCLHCGDRHHTQLCQLTDMTAHRKPALSKVKTRQDFDKVSNRDTYTKRRSPSYSPRRSRSRSRSRRSRSSSRRRHSRSRSSSRHSHRRSRLRRSRSTSRKRRLRSRSPSRQLYSPPRYRRSPSRSRLEEIAVSYINSRATRPSRDREERRDSSVTRTDHKSESYYEHQSDNQRDRPRADDSSNRELPPPGTEDDKYRVVDSCDADDLEDDELRTEESISRPQRISRPLPFHEHRDDSSHEDLAPPGTEEELEEGEVSREEERRELLSHKLTTPKPLAKAKGTPGKNAKKPANQDKPVRSCIKCSESHPLYKCSTFQSTSQQEKKDFVLRKKLCENCLGFHAVDKCKSQNRCNYCNEKHHTILCSPNSTATS